MYVYFVGVICMKFHTSVLDREVDRGGAVCDNYVYNDLNERYNFYLQFHCVDKVI